jgi:hypothetical protein
MDYGALEEYFRRLEEDDWRMGIRQLDYLCWRLSRQGYDWLAVHAAREHGRQMGSVCIDLFYQRPR